MNKPKNWNYIKRGYYSRWRGCYVQVPRMPGRLFSYSAYASEQLCERDALAYRDWCVQQIGGWDAIPKRGGGHKDFHQKYARPLKRNKLGILGVHVADRWRIRPGGTRYRVREVVAQLRIVGVKDFRARFPFRRGSKQQAIERAVAARRKFERERDRLLGTHVHSS
jgi:hypothetical protein